MEPEQDPSIYIYLMIALMTVTCIVEWIRLTSWENIKENVVESIEKMKKHPVLKFIIPSLMVISVYMIIANLLFWIIDLRNLGLLMKPFDITGSLVFLGGGFMVCRGISRYFVRYANRNDLRYLPKMAIECYYLTLLALFFQLSYLQMLLLDQAFMDEINGLTLFESFMKSSDDQYILIGFFSLFLLMGGYAFIDVLDRSSEKEELLKEIERELKDNTFRINEYLELRLIHDETIIFVKGEKFLQCKSLMINISPEEIPEYDEINSIDEAEQLNIIKNPHGTYKFNITPEEEFWGHCSNLQAWHENNYDPRLLHSNLALPLLKELTKAGDPRAKIIFKETIARKFEEEGFKMVFSLYGLDPWGPYLFHLTIEEIKALKLPLKVIKTLLKWRRNHLREQQNNEGENE